MNGVEMLGVLTEGDLWAEERSVAGDTAIRYTRNYCPLALKSRGGGGGGFFKILVGGGDYNGRG